MSDTLKKFRLSLKDFGASSLDDVEAIKNAQRRLGVKDDGVIGPNTCFAFYKARKLVIDNRDSISFDRKSYKFKRVSPRSKLPSIVVIHDSIAPTVKSTYNSLEYNTPKYSSHYMIDYSGQVFEACNPLTHYTIHAGALNDESIGIDMVNILDPRLIDKKGFNQFNAIERVRKADWSSSMVKPGFAVDYTESQKRSLVGLCDYLSELFNIPMVVPEGMTGYGKKVSGFTEEYVGFCAHGQWSTKRWDGLFGVETLIENGYKAVKL